MGVLYKKKDTGGVFGFSETLQSSKKKEKLKRERPFVASGTKVITGTSYFADSHITCNYKYLSYSRMHH